MSVTIKKYHTRLADYFNQTPLFFDDDAREKPNIRKCAEQPWQQTRAEMWDQVTDMPCDLDFIQAKTCAKMTYDLVKGYHFALAGLPEAQPLREKERKRRERMEKYTRDLIAHAEGDIKSLDIPESAEPWPNGKIETEIERIKNSPTRLDRMISAIFSTVLNY